MKRFATVILLLFIGVIATPAAKVYEAWVNHFPQTAWINVFSDNLGRIAAVGAAPTGTALVLLDSDGSVVASRNDPSGFAQAAGADNTGNIYFAGNCSYGAVICATKYRAALSTRLWA